MDFLQRLLAMRHMLAPNPPDPSQGGGFIPDWSTGHPPAPKPPMPRLPDPLAAIQAPPEPPPQAPPPMSPVMGGASGPMPMSASIPSMIQRPPASSMPPIKPTIPASMGGPMAPQSQSQKLPGDLQQAPPAPPPMDTTGPGMDEGSMEGLPGSDLVPTMDAQPPLEASPMGGDLGTGLPGQSPQMSINVPGGEQAGGGDLVSLIKRLLHKR